MIRVHGAVEGGPDVCSRRGREASGESALGATRDSGEKGELRETGK